MCGSCLCAPFNEEGSKFISTNVMLYYIHFEITGDPCNLIGSQQCDLFPNCTILNRILSFAHQNGNEVTKIEYSY